MRSRPMFFLVTILIIAVGLAAVGIGAGKPKNTTTKTTQNASAKQDHPGTIDGKVNPELIPDHIAYTLVFRTIALHQNTDFEKRRSRAWAKSVGLDDAGADKLLAAANEFHMRVSVLDNQVKEIKNRSWPNPGAQVMAQLTDLQEKKEAIVAEIVSSLPTRLGSEWAGKLHNHINSDVKRKMKHLPSAATTPGNR